MWQKKRWKSDAIPSQYLVWRVWVWVLGWAGVVYHAVGAVYCKPCFYGIYPVMNVPAPPELSLR